MSLEPLVFLMLLAYVIIIILSLLAWLLLKGIRSPQNSAEASSITPSPKLAKSQRSDVSKTSKASEEAAQQDSRILFPQVKASSRVGSEGSSAPTSLNASPNNASPNISSNAATTPISRFEANPKLPNASNKDIPKTPIITLKSPQQQPSPSTPSASNPLPKPAPIPTDAFTAFGEATRHEEAISRPSSTATAKDSGFQVEVSKNYEGREAKPKLETSEQDLKNTALKNRLGGRSDKALDSFTKKNQ